VTGRTGLGSYLARRALERGEKYLKRGEIIAALVEFREAEFYLRSEGLVDEATSIGKLISYLEKLSGA